VTTKFDFTGRFAAVTGGAQGIGRAAVERLLSGGAGVAIWDADAALGAQVASELSDFGKVFALPVDVTDTDAVDRARDATLDRFGSIDLFVNNAGVAGTVAKTWDYAPDEWDRVVRINLRAPFNCMRAVLPGMIERNYGRIVNVASIAGKEGNPNACAYSASKAGLIGLTKSAAKEVAEYNIAINALTPAAVRTAIFDQITQQHIDYMLSRIPRGRFGTVEEIGNMIAFMCSEECSFTTGAVFDISGGRATY
jgi:3-oxoacyl-[acyl-carrier protein] reductase